MGREVGLIKHLNSQNWVDENYIYNGGGNNFDLGGSASVNLAWKKYGIF